MSYLPALWKDLYDRAKADTGSGGLFNVGTPLVSGIFNTYAPVAQAFPHMVYVLESAAQNDAMNTASRMVEWSLHTYLAEEPADGSDPHAAYASIMDRILGDWHAQSNRTPTYGFDRWTFPLASSGWTATINQHRNSRTSHDTGVLHFVEEFIVYVSKSGV